MHSQLRDEQRKQFATFLAHQRTCIISTITSQSVWAMPVWYRPTSGASGRHNPKVDCLVPRWADIAHHLSKAAEVLLIIQASSGVGLRWLQIQGTARPIETPDWTRLLPRWASKVQPEALYQVVRVTPSRIDLVDEDQGWGVQETLEW
ncbi:MAG: hypothetical protein PVG14_04505 [Anaerolineales bacterium]|jgi:hypothetical protein